MKNAEGRGFTGRERAKPVVGCILHRVDVVFCRATKVTQITATEASSSKDRPFEHKDVFLSTRLFYLT